MVVLQSAGGTKERRNWADRLECTRRRLLQGRRDRRTLPCRSDGLRLMVANLAKNGSGFVAFGTDEPQQPARITSHRITGNKKKLRLQEGEPNLLQKNSAVPNDPIFL